MGYYYADKDNHDFSEHLFNDLSNQFRLKGNGDIACNHCGTEYHPDTEFHACGLCGCGHDDEDHTTLDDGWSECKHCDCDLYQGSIGKYSGKNKKDYDHIIKHRKGDPTDKELYSKVKSEAKQKFDVYPSAVANAWVVKEYKKRGGKYGKEKESSMNWYHEAAYNKTTGEWKPEEWSHEPYHEISFMNYPPYNENGIDNSINVTEPNSATNIGKGHLFSGHIEHEHPEGRTDNFTGMYDIYGRSKNLDEAKTEAKKYEDLHNATYHASYDNGHVVFHHEPINDKHGNQIGVSWSQAHFLPIDYVEGENDVDTVKKHIEHMHKFLYDRNNNTLGGQKPMFSSKNWYDR